MLMITPFLYISLSITDVRDKLLGHSYPLAREELSLSDRQPDKWVNQIFRDNILLSLAYMEGTVKKGDAVDWSKVKHFNHYEFVLNPNQVFAFHDQVLPDFRNKVSQTTHSHFSTDEGFKSDGYLPGDGVCHLASLFNWAAQEANLDVKAPTSHDFAPIPDVPKEYGVSIYTQPSSLETSASQNLYITNNRQKPIKFIIDYEDNKVSLTVDEINEAT